MGDEVGHRTSFTAALCGCECSTTLEEGAVALQECGGLRVIVGPRFPEDLAFLCEQRGRDLINGGPLRNGNALAPLDLS